MSFPVTSMTFSSIAPVHKYVALVLGVGMFSSVPFSIIEPSCNYTAQCRTVERLRVPGQARVHFAFPNRCFFSSGQTGHLFDW